MFRNVRILHPAAAFGFLAATLPQDGDEAKERLGNAVRTLEMTITTKQMITLLPFVIRHCPRLHELSLSFHTDMDVNTLLKPPPILSESQVIPSTPDSPLSIPPGSQAWLTISYGDIPLPPIQALRISCTLSPSTLSQRLIKIFPGVRHLVVSGQALVELCLTPQSSTADLEGSLELRLYEFQTGRSLNRAPPVAAHTIRASLRNSIGTLQILDLTGISPGLIGLSEQLFTEHGPHLRSLRLPSISRDIRLPFLKYCTELEEIAIAGLPSKYVMVSCPLGKIQHASFTMLTSQVNDPITPILNWLKRFPSLEVLSWSMHRVPAGPQRGEITAKIRKFCAKNRVRMRTPTTTELEVRINPSWLSRLLDESPL